MLQRLVSKSLAKTTNVRTFMVLQKQVQRTQITPLTTSPLRFMAANSDESNFDGHSDFEPKSKATGNEALNKQITEWVEGSDVAVFMKGNRKMPRCGFSNYVVQIFKFYGVKEYKDVNVLEDDNLREYIKEYSNWPTIPQVYVKGQFLGGCDILKEMHADGTLEELLIREGIIKAD